jgi:hypothetical protein
LPEAPPKEENERHAGKNVVPRHNISIRDVISGKSNIPEQPVKSAETEPEIPGEDEPVSLLENEFNQEQLEMKWKSFADSIQTDKPRMAIALRSKQPLLKPGFEVEVLLENSTLQDDFTSNVRSPLQSYLRKELLNDSIKVSVRIEDIIDDGKRKMYTTEEKLQYLVNKNPSLIKLKQQFNLELE